MSTTQVWDVVFRVVKLSAGSAGPAYQYIKPERRAQVAAATQGGVLAVLQADIPIGANETIEVLNVRQSATTGESVGGSILS